MKFLHHVGYSGNYRRDRSNYGHDEQGSHGYLFSMEHVLQSMATPSDANTWYIDSRCMNHMTCHGEYFNDKMKMHNM